MIVMERGSVKNHPTQPPYILTVLILNCIQLQPPSN